MHPKTMEALNKVAEEWNKKLEELGPDKFKEWLLEDFVPDIKRDIFGFEMRCVPETCHGECQGMGWCDIAKSFREEE